MGLEAINYIFRSEMALNELLYKNRDISQLSRQYYCYCEAGKFWIYLELHDNHTLSIRIALCNPIQGVLNALSSLIEFLYSQTDGWLFDMHSKEKYSAFNPLVAEKLKYSFLNKRSTFSEMYGEMAEAIGSDEFYKRFRPS